MIITGSSGSTQNTSPSWTWGDRSGSFLDSILYVILSRKDKTGSSQVQLGLVFWVDPLDLVILESFKFIIKRQGILYKLLYIQWLYLLVIIKRKCLIIVYQVIIFNKFLHDQRLLVNISVLKIKKEWTRSGSLLPSFPY